MATLDVTKHALVPKQTKLSEKDRKALFEHYAIEHKDLPRVLITDPGIAHLSVKEGDIIKVERKSLTAGKAVFYRRVVS